MQNEDIKTGQIFTAMKYNAISHAKWHRDWDKAKSEGRDWGQMPQLAFYGFYSPKTGELRKVGYVRKTENGAHWFKTKKEAFDYIEKIYS